MDATELHTRAYLSEMVPVLFRDMKKKELEKREKEYIETRYLDDYVDVTLPYYHDVSEAVLDSVCAMYLDPYFASVVERALDAAESFGDEYEKLRNEAFEARKYDCEILPDCPEQYQDTFRELYKIRKCDVALDAALKQLEYTYYSKRKKKHLIDFAERNFFTIMCNCYYKQISLEELEFYLLISKDPNVQLLYDISLKLRADVFNWEYKLTEKVKTFISSK
ncbi:MAG: hypothetical protein J6Y15_09150 [Bacteroidaceae bacterium]|nr:hypothetical protein [Bacteroidaceae bacterium]